MVRRIGLVAMLAVSACLVLTTSAYAGHRRGCHGGGHARQKHHRHHGHSGCGSCGGCEVAAPCGGGCAPVSTCGGCASAASACGGYAMASVEGTSYAALIVNLPEGATLIVDGQVVAAAPGTQVFYTPDILPNEDYHYNLTVRVSHDGQTSDVTRTVVVRAGEESNVDFDAVQTVSVTE